ncbi:MAG TPA: hypothetical protein VMJ14_12720 [Burkholderiales bacterium]|nr:hypothetical protein [Burkholderiales bacterium]
MGILKFRVARMRPALLGIAEVEGRAGIWPLRRTVRYRVGANCDAIRIEGRKLVVLQGGRQIAEARYKPKPIDPEATSALDWEQLLQPRDRNKR